MHLKIILFENNASCINIEKKCFIKFKKNILHACTTLSLLLELLI